jgi:acetyl esterase/lipase
MFNGLCRGIIFHSFTLTPDCWQHFLNLLAENLLTMQIQFFKNIAVNRSMRGTSMAAVVSWCLLTVIAFTQFGCSDDENTLNAKEELVMKDVSYGSDPLNTMDIHLPANRTSKTKVIVFIHGGGWKEGSKEQFDIFVGQFVAAGFATASINYRHANVNENILYTDLLQDIDDALLYLRNEAGENVYNGDNVVLMGHSAGAHLALLYAYRNNERKQVKSVISLSAPTDLIELLQEGVFPDLLYNLVGSDEQSKYIDASPVYHVKEGAIPTYIFHGREDQSVPTSQAQELYDELSKRTPSVHLKLIDDAGHDFTEETYPLIIQESINFSKTN